MDYSAASDDAQYTVHIAEMGCRLQNNEMFDSTRALVKAASYDMCTAVVQRSFRGPGRGLVVALPREYFLKNIKQIRFGKKKI